jgi:hypothetical protein
MVPNLILTPDFFGPHHGPNFLGPKFLGAQISQVPKKSGAQMRSGTISVIAIQKVQDSFSPANTALKSLETTELSNINEKFDLKDWTLHSFAVPDKFV